MTSSNNCGCVCNNKRIIQSGSNAKNREARRESCLSLSDERISSIVRCYNEQSCSWRDTTPSSKSYSYARRELFHSIFCSISPRYKDFQLLLAQRIFQLRYERQPNLCTLDCTEFPFQSRFDRGVSIYPRSLNSSSWHRPTPIV